MNPDPFLRKQFVSDKLVSTQAPEHQGEGDAPETFCGSVLAWLNTGPWCHRWTETEHTHPHTHPHTQLITAPLAACVGTTHTHTQLITTPLAACVGTTHTHS